MVEYISVETAKKKIRKLVSSTTSLNREDSLREFNKIVASVEPGAEVRDKKFAYWSGGFSPEYRETNIPEDSKWKNISAQLASSALADQSKDIGIISESNYGKLLSDKETLTNYTTITGAKTKKEKAEVRQQYGSGLNGPWAEASQKTAEHVKGDVLAFTPYETGKNIFSEREFPALLKNEKVTSVNGIPVEKLREMAADPQLGIDAARHEVNLVARDYASELTTRTAKNGEMLAKSDKFLNDQDISEKKDFQKTLDERNSDKSITLNSPEVKKESEKVLKESYAKGNKFAQKSHQKKAVDKLEGRPSRSGHYFGEIKQVTTSQVSQTVRGGHVYVHNIKSSKHELKQGDIAKISVSKGKVISTKKEVAKVRSKGSRLSLSKAKSR